MTQCILTSPVITLSRVSRASPSHWKTGVWWLYVCHSRVVAFLFPTGWLSFAWFLCVDWSLVVCVSRIQLNYTVSLLFQLCGPADYLWTMELHSDHEGLHRPRPNGSYPAKHRHSAGPETLGGAEDGWAGWKNGPSGDWLLLGNRSAVTKWKPEIWSYHQGVRDTERLMVIKPVFVVAGQFLSCLFFCFWAAARTLLTKQWRWRAMDWECPTTSLSTCSSSLARLVTSTCTAD